VSVLASSKVVGGVGGVESLLHRLRSTNGTPSNGHLTL